MMQSIDVHLFPSIIPIADQAFDTSDFPIPFLDFNFPADSITGFPNINYLDGPACLHNLFVVFVLASAKFASTILCSSENLAQRCSCPVIKCQRCSNGWHIWLSAKHQYKRGHPR